MTYGTSKWIVADFADGTGSGERKLLLVRRKPVKAQTPYQQTELTACLGKLRDAGMAEPDFF